MKLSRKLPLAICAALMVTASAGLFGVLQLRLALDQVEQTLAGDLGLQRQSLQLLVDFKVQVQEWKNLLLRGKDPQSMDKHWQAVVQQEQAVITTAGTLLGNMEDGKARDLMLQFALAHAAMSEGYRQGFEAYKTAGNDPQVGDRAVAGMDREPADLLAQVVTLTDGQGKSALAAADGHGQRALWISLSAMLLTCVACTAGGLVMSRKMTDPLNEAAQMAAAVAEGDLTREVRPRGEDEVRQLLESLDGMTRRLGGIVATVRLSSDSIATGSSEVAAGSSDLSRRTEAQASSLQQTAAAMEQLNGTVAHSASTARQASELAQSASGAAAQGGEVVAQVVATMNEISESSRRIVDIVGVIDGIAFQTNILALNAAVEAARAGEQGRGFAVVAAEVRALAQRSATAAREVKTLIAASAERVETGTLRVGEAGRSMDTIVTQVRQVADLIGEISRAAAEQTTGISQVNAAVAQLDQATQQNSALVEQSTAAAESLQQQAQTLVHAVHTFRLRDT